MPQAATTEPFDSSGRFRRRGEGGMMPSMRPLPTVLDQIIAHKRTEVAAAKERLPAALLERQLEAAPPVRDFVAALAAARGVGLIAEVKQASPSAGVLCTDFHPVRIATAYERAGASCLSVLTDEQFFQGHLDDLYAVRQAVSIPVLRKDFVIDRYQILEARAAGADCVLLIAECLDDAALAELFGAIRELGMHALVELYEPENLDRVLRLDPPLVGINNRNLKTFETDLGHTTEWASQIPAGTLLVSESGIRTRADVERLTAACVRAILVGETLMRADDVTEAIRELIGD
jgi:indole-3-glycerol phosphate synthase